MNLPRRKTVSRIWALVFAMGSGLFEYRYTHSYDAAATITFALFAILEALDND